jgi:gliding motility-associated-like protein
MDGTIPGFDGVQVAIYSSCAPSYTPVDCDVSSNDCDNNDNKELNLTGLIVGDVYYFLVDGCASATCDIEIDVLGICGIPILEPWNNPVSGPLEVCAGSTENYFVDDIDGANMFHWYIDGVNVADTPDNTYDIDWTDAGNFELCVDASNDPCIPEIGDLDPICIMIEVYDAEAGAIVANPEILCPSETSTITVSGYNSFAPFETSILVADETGSIIDIVAPDQTTLSSDMCTSFTVCNYNYVSTLSSLPALGSNITDIDCSLGCCHIECVVVTFEDTEDPNFNAPPASINITCIDQLPILEDLEWLDNCDGTGFVEGIEMGSIDNCTGGSISRNWEYTDMCNNTATHIQMITLVPPPVESFIDPPADITVDCMSIPTSAPDLMYTNNGQGACLYTATVPTVLSGSADVCGGLIEFTWEYTDPCNNPISYTQSVTVDPAPEPDYLNLPPDLTVSCDAIPTSAPDLEYSNGLTDDCGINGFVQATQTGGADECGGVILFIWDFTDACGTNLNHVQNVTVNPAADPSFIDPPADVTIACDESLASIPDLDYNNGLTDDCEIDGSLTGFQMGTATLCGGNVEYIWESTICGSPLQHIQTITIGIAPEANFLDVPDDITLSCENFSEDLPFLNYDNLELGDCSLFGSIEAEIIGDPNPCGGTIEYVWTYVDPCGRLTTANQNVTIEQVPPAIFFNVPGSTTVSCDDPILTTPPSLNYDNGGSGLCAIFGSVEPVQLGSFDACGGDIIFEWSFTDDCGRTISHQQNVEILPASSPEFINPPQDITLACTENSVPPYEIDFTNSEDGDCESTGSVFSSVVNNDNQSIHTWEIMNPCNGSIIEHNQTITIPDLPELSISNIECGVGGLDYSVSFTTNGSYQVIPNFGTVNIDGDIYTITNIPISNPLSIALFDVGANCEVSFDVSPPDCDCPFVEPPSSTGDESVCFGDPTPALIVSLEPDLIANWYASASGSDLIASNVLEYTPTVTAPGSYTYYVEAESISSAGCVSLIRTPITLTIFPEVQASDATLMDCDGDQDGSIEFLLANANDLISTSALEIQYFNTVDDAENIANPIITIIVSTFPQTLFAVVTDVNNCSVIVSVELDIIPSPIFSVEPSPETCPGDMDGSVTINYNQATNNTLYSLDGINWQSQNVFSGLLAGVYIAYVQNDDGCIAQQDFTIAAAPIMGIITYELICNDNQTGTDDSDDFYTLIFQLSNSDPALTSYELDINTVLNGSYIYNETYSEVFPADGSILQLIFTDVQTQCLLEQISIPLASCSGDCAIIAELVNSICNDNGTTSDPSDDFYNIEINAEVVNSESSQTYNLTLDGTTVATGMYSEVLSITLPAVSSSVEFILIDSENELCITPLEISDLFPCSDDCFLEGTISNLVCDDAGTEGVVEDDIFFFDLDVNGLNTSGAWSVNNMSQTGIIGQTSTLGPFLISDGNIDWVISDANEQSCSFNLEITAPAPCSLPCEIELTEWTISDCNNGGTGNTDDDDSFSIIFQINPILGNTTEIIVEIGTDSFGPFNYNELNTVDNLPANGEDIIIRIFDANNSLCLLEQIVNVSPCSSCIQQVDAGENQRLTCIDESIQLSAFTTEEGNVLWVGPNGFNQNNNPVNVTIPGIYYLTVDFGNACVFTDSVIVDQAPDIEALTAEATQIDCEGDTDGSISINEIQGGTEPYSYWLDGVEIQNTKIPNLSSGTYLLEVTDNNGCIADTTMILNQGQIINLFLEPQISLNVGESGVLEAMLNLSPGDIQSVQWSPSDNLSCDTCLVTSIAGQTEGIYTIEIISQDGCIASATVNVSLITVQNVFVPNIFSPNNDGTNDVFTVFTDENTVLVKAMRIYDRWGELIFENLNFAPNITQEGWDGRFKNTDIMPGVYVYMIEVENANGETDIYSGDITIIK